MHSSRGMGKSGRAQPAPNRLTHSRLSVSGAADSSADQRVGFILSTALANQEYWFILFEPVTAVGSSRLLVQ